jgi:hypothetical protein
MRHAECCNNSQLSAPPVLGAQSHLIQNSRGIRISSGCQNMMITSTKISSIDWSLCGCPGTAGRTSDGKKLRSWVNSAWWCKVLPPACCLCSFYSYSCSGGKRLLSSSFPSVRMYQRDFHSTDFREISSWVLLWNSDRELHIWLKSENNSGQRTGRPK